MRLKRENLAKAKVELTNCELGLYLYIAQRVDLNGLVQRILMREAITSICITKQSFYNCLYALQKKGFLHIHKKDNNGFDILLANNRFVDEKATGDTYINLNYRILNSLDFYRAPINLKRFILDALSFSNLSSWKISNDMLKKYGLSVEDIKPFTRKINTYKNVYNETIHSIEVSTAITKSDNNIFFNTLKHRLTNFFRTYNVNYTYQDFKDVLALWITNRDVPGIVGSAILKTSDYELLQPKLINYHIKKAKLNICL